jgi:hypothetical protein
LRHKHGVIRGVAENPMVRRCGDELIEDVVTAVGARRS